METKCVRHDNTRIVVHDEEAFEFKCLDCGKIIKKDNKIVFEQAKSILELICAIGGKDEDGN